MGTCCGGEHRREQKKSMKDEYDDDKTNPIWDEYPLIKTYRIEWKNYIDKIKEKNKKEFLKKCPLCRK